MLRCPVVVATSRARREAKSAMKGDATAGSRDTGSTPHRCRAWVSVTLNIFGVNAAEHHINIPDFGKNFVVKRGMLARTTFKVKKPGLYPIMCITHQPAHRADLLVSSCA
jgi:hypothetical protein